MNWLITGGCGFIGSALVNKLFGQGRNKLRIVDNNSVGQISALNSPVREITKTSDISGWSADHVDVCQFDILDKESALEIAKGADVIVHLAANTGVQPSIKEPHMDCMTNVVGTLNYLDAARHCGVKRFVFASSGAPVGEIVPPIHEEVVPHPVSPYGASKLAGEAYCSAYKKSFDLDTVALRFGNVYGPGSGHKTSVVAKFCGAVMRGEALTVYGDGTQTRDFIYLYDLIEAIEAAVGAEDVGGEVFQIATSRETAVNEIIVAITEIAQEMGYDCPPVEKQPPLKGDVMRNFSDTTKAKERLGWNAKTSLKQGLKITFNDFT